MVLISCFLKPLMVLALTYVTVHTGIPLQVHFSSNDQIVGLTLFVKFT